MTKPTRRRKGGRAATAASASSHIEQPASRSHRRLFEPTRAVSDDEVEAIHHASLRVLSDVGIDVLHPQARNYFTEAGAMVGSESGGDPIRVRFDPEMIEHAITTCPSEFELHSRGPHRTVTFGSDNVVFGAVASPPNSSDIAGGRRTGNNADFQNLVRLSQHLNAIQVHGGYPVEPADIHPSVRHLHATFDLLTLSDKPINAYSLGLARNLDTLEMARIARGIDHDTLQNEPSIFTIINTSSPLRLDDPMCQGIITYAEHNQISVITPFTLAGAMAPVTVVGAVVQQNAEALAGMALAQLVRPGAPVMYGGFTSNVDMKSGSPAFGTPEFMKSALLGGQMARRYGVPYRSSNVNAANAVDAQAAWNRCFHSGARSWAAQTWCSTALAGWKAGFEPASRKW